MYTAVSHLLYNSPRAPRLLLVNVGHEFIPFGKASFAQVVETLRRANPDDVAVGLLTEDGSMMICPEMRFVHEFGPGDIANAADLIRSALGAGGRLVRTLY